MDSSGPSLSNVAGNLGISSQGDPAAQRGTPRGGVGPNFQNYMLGGSPDYLNQLQGTTGNIANQASVSNAYGQAALGQAFAPGQNAPTTNYGNGYAAALGGVSNLGNTQAGLAGNLQQVANQQAGQPSSYAALQNFANQPQGPSAAQAQLQQGNNQALNAQLALARSGSGFGESANALGAAQQNASGIMSNNANQAATLRAQEGQAYRQQQLGALQAGGQLQQQQQQAQTQAQLQALGLAGQNLQNASGNNLQLANAYQQAGQFNTNAALQQQQLNQARQLGLLNAGGQLNTAGTQQQIAANQLGLQGEAAQLQGTMGYEGDVNNLYGLDIGAHTQDRQLNQQNSTNWLSGITGAVGALGSAFGLSDRRAKKNVRRASLDEHFAALGVEP